MQGKVQMKDPTNTFYLIQSADPITLDNPHPLCPRYWYFGRLVADGNRHAMQTLNISQRKFTGE